MHVFPEPIESLSRASLGRRLAAMFYDSLLCIALLMVTTGIYMAINYLVLGGETYKQINEAGKSTSDPLLSSVLFITLFMFFAYFWVRTGQTLGMQVWHIRVQNEDNSPITMTQALLRFLMAFVSMALFGLGYLWMLFDKKDRTWQCMFSDSRVYRIPKRQ